MAGAYPKTTCANLTTGLDLEGGSCSGVCWAPRAVCCASHQQATGGGNSLLRGTQQGSSILNSLSRAVDLRFPHQPHPCYMQALFSTPGSWQRLLRSPRGETAELWGHEKKPINLSEVTVSRSAGSSPSAFPAPGGGDTEKRMGTSKLLLSHRWTLRETGPQSPSLSFDSLRLMMSLLCILQRDATQGPPPLE